MKKISQTYINDPRKVLFSAHILSFARGENRMG